MALYSLTQESKFSASSIPHPGLGSCGNLVGLASPSAFNTFPWKPDPTEISAAASSVKRNTSRLLQPVTASAHGPQEQRSKSSTLNTLSWTFIFLVPPTLAFRHIQPFPRPQHVVFVNLRANVRATHTYRDPPTMVTPIYVDRKRLHVRRALRSSRRSFDLVTLHIN